MKNKGLSLLLLMFSYTVFAQQVLTLEDAVRIALENNYQIKIAQNESQIAHINNHPGAAGMLPTIAVNATDNPALNNLKQEFTNGSTIERNNVGSNALAANVALNYTIFDGLKMFATKKRLAELDLLGENKLKSQIQNTLSQVIQRYSAVIKQQSYLTVVQQLQKVSEDRLQLVKLRQTAGMANNTDLYLAELDFTSRNQAVLSQVNAVKSALTDLNIALNFPADSTYSLNANLPVTPNLRYAELVSLVAMNPEILANENQINISLQAQKEIQAARLPQLKLSAAYNYNLSQSQAGFTLFNQAYGPSALVTLSVPVFSGNVNARNLKSAKLQTQNAELQLEQNKKLYQGLLLQTWQMYSMLVAQMEIDKSDSKTAKDYLDLMTKRYQMGQSTVVDYREAQRSFEEVNYRVINNLYLAKLAETDLLRLSGQLIK